MLIVPGSTLAQNSEANTVIKGTVAKAGTDQPLSGARVSVLRVDVTGQTTQDPTILLLIGNSRTVTKAVADSDGHFEVPDLSPGRYRIFAESMGFLRHEYGQTTPAGAGVVVTIGAAQRLTMDFHLVPFSVITGRVESSGIPTVRAQLHAFSNDYRDGFHILREAATAQTNDLGEYRLFGLTAGDFFVSVDTASSLDVLRTGRVTAGTQSDRNTREFQVPVPPLFYPGTYDMDQATLVQVGVSAEVHGIDFRLQPVASVKVSGRIVAPFPLVAKAAQPPFVTAPGATATPRGGVQSLQDAFSQTSQIVLTRVSAIAGNIPSAGLGLNNPEVATDGTFAMRGVVPGSYFLTATARDRSGQPFTARTRIEVGQADINNVILAVRPGIEVRGRVAFSSPGPATLDLNKLRVILIGIDDPTGTNGSLADMAASSYEAGAAASQGINQGRGQSPGPSTTTTAGQSGAEGFGSTQRVAGAVALDGTFTLKNVPSALEYRLHVTGLPKGTYLESGSIGSTDMLMGPFSVGDQSVTTMELRLGFSPGRITGTVVDATRNPRPDAVIALIPDARERPDLYFSGLADKNGRFTFDTVPPGNYHLFAWDSIANGSYQSSAFLQRFNDRGQPVHIDKNSLIEGEIKVLATQ
jgi:hypothetical protein